MTTELPLLQSKRLTLGVLPPEAAARVVEYYRKNEAHHGPWDPPHPERWLTEPYWAERLRSSQQMIRDDLALRLFLTRCDDPQGPVIGACNFTGIVRGPFQCARLGYSLDVDCVGQGLMTEALQRALDYVFGDLGLHRVEANYVPSNERSGRLLRRLGFQIQGYARDYLYIDGAWRDHILTALTTPNPQPPPAAL